MPTAKVPATCSGCRAAIADSQKGIGASMVLPLWDHSPFKWPTPPYVMWSLIVINFLVFFVQAAGGSDQMDQVDHVAGLDSGGVLRAAGIAGALPAPLTLITSMFLHANFMHVFGNMIFLFVFGDDIEEVLGHWRFLVFLPRLRHRRRPCLCVERSEFDDRTDRRLRRRRRRHFRLSAVPAMRQGRRSCLASFRFASGPIGSSAAGRSGKSSKSRAAPRTASPIGRMSAD